MNYLLAFTIFIMLCFLAPCFNSCKKEKWTYTDDTRFKKSATMFDLTGDTGRVFNVIDYRTENFYYDTVARKYITTKMVWDEEEGMYFILFPDTTYITSEIFAKKAELPRAGKFKLGSFADSGYRSFSFGKTDWLITEYSYKKEGKPSGLLIMRDSVGIRPNPQIEYTIIAKH